MTDSDLKVLVASIAEGQKRTDAQLAKTDAQLAKTDAQLAKTSAKIDKLARMYGGLANNQGAVAEEFYYNTLKDAPRLQGMQFDVVYKNLMAKYQDIEDEYDIVLANGKTVYIIEVKYKVHPTDIQRLVNKKAPNFQKLFRQYVGFEQYLGLACFRIDEPVKQQALAQGVSVLQRKGQLIETIAA